MKQTQNPLGTNQKNGKEKRERERERERGGGGERKRAKNKKEEVVVLGLQGYVNANQDPNLSTSTATEDATCIKSWHLLLVWKWKQHQITGVSATLQTLLNATTNSWHLQLSMTT
jgi:hypothetical protein